MQTAASLVSRVFQCEVLIVSYHQIICQSILYAGKSNLCVPVVPKLLLLCESSSPGLCLCILRGQNQINWRKIKLLHNWLFESCIHQNWEPLLYESH